MTFSFTGLAYLLGFFAVSLLTYRFYQYWRRERTTVSKLFFCFCGIFGLFILITAITGLFFAKNIQILKGTVISAAFLQGLASAIIAYLITYLKFPKISPWSGFTIIFLLGLTATIITILVPFYPFLEESGAINWDFQPLANVFRFSVFLITFVPLTIILIQEFRASGDPFLRAKFLGMALLLLFGLITGLFDFLLENILKLGAISSDIIFGFFSFSLLILAFLTQKSLPSEPKYIPPPSSPKISW
jgi:hypothetical protein